LRVVTAFHLGGVGGPSRSLAGAMAWLAERGEVSFLFPEDGDAAAEYRALGPVGIAPYSALTYARTPPAAARAVRDLARDVRTFRRELRRLRPDLLVAVTTVLPAALAAARIEGVPAVVYAAEVYSQPWKRSPALELWGAGLARGTARLASGLVCCSRLVAAQFPDGRVPLAIAYPPVGGEYAGGDRAAARARFGCEDADPCIAVVGNLSRGRGQDLGIRALAEVRRVAPAARLLLVGAAHPRPVDRAYAGELRALARDLGVEGAVAFTGSVPAIAGVYAAADVVVNPARTAESFGRVAAEALVAGRPPVTTDVGAVREVIRDGVDGIVVPPERPDAIAAAVLGLWRDPERARRLAAAGAERVRSRFGPEQDLAAWRSVIGAVSG
jgi:glycosyltransferase involved in cell wall biosynthesis